MRILIVDDNLDNLQMAADTVRFAGHEPVTAQNGYDALDVLAATGIQFVIADWMMPEMDGLELVNRIRAQFSERYIYIIMLTAKGEPDDVAEGLEGGADDYISKPFLPREMRARISTGVRIIDVQSRLAESVEAMRTLADRDHLTRLYNRRYFNELATEMLATHPIASLFMLDIDHFKQVNDNYGHIAGDSVLRQVAALCEQTADTNGTMGRYGGEEFIGILPGCNGKDALKLTDELRQTIAQTPMKLTGDVIHVTVSIGIAVYQASLSPSLLDLVKTADDALYRAKTHGRNRVELASE